MEPTTVLILSILSAVITSSIATNKGRGGCLWFIIGFFFSLFGPLLALLLSDRSESLGSNTPDTGMKKCPHCAEKIQGEAKVCRYCGRDIDKVN